LSPLLAKSSGPVASLTGITLTIALIMALSVALNLASLATAGAGTLSSVTAPGGGRTADQLVFDDQLQNHVAGLESLVTNKAADAGKRNEDVVVVSFFASWCPPCRDEFAALNEVLSTLGDHKVSVVAINSFEEFDDNDATRLASFLGQTDPQFQVVKGTTETLALFGGVNRIPTLFVFDQKGNQVYSFVHARGASKRSAEANELLAAITPLLQK